MTSEQIKLEIQKSLEDIPETALQAILEYLQELKGKARNDIDLSRNLRKVLQEDANLLQRLAQ